MYEWENQVGQGRAEVDSAVWGQWLQQFRQEDQVTLPTSQVAALWRRKPFTLNHVGIKGLCQHTGLHADSTGVARSNHKNTCR